MQCPMHLVKQLAARGARCIRGPVFPFERPRLPTRFGMCAGVYVCIMVLCICVYHVVMCMCSVKHMVSGDV